MENWVSGAGWWARRVRVATWMPCAHGCVGGRSDVSSAEATDCGVWGCGVKVLLEDDAASLEGCQKRSATTRETHEARERAATWGILLASGLAVRAAMVVVDGG